MKNNKGITLIALVLTIIILLLLAGISINMIAGQDGILTKAANAKKEMNKAELEEKIGLAVAEWELEKGSNSNYNTTLEEHLKTKTDIKSEEPLTWVSGDNVVTIGSNKLTVNSKSKNLIKNGYLENKNNDNFTTFNYHKDGYLYLTYDKIVNGKPYVSNEFIPVDTSKKYIQRVTARRNNQNTTVSIGIIEYDVDYKIITAENYIYVKDTLTYLTQDLKDGDTEIYVNDLSNFLYNNKLSKNQKGLIFWNYKDSTGYEYEQLTYSRNVYTDLFDYSESNPAIDKENNIIKLKKPWNKGNISAGTQLSQTSNSAWYNYGLSQNTLTSEWQTYSNTVQGTITEGKASYQKFRPGTKYVKFLCLVSIDDENETLTVDLKDIAFEEVD